MLSKLKSTLLPAALATALGGCSFGGQISDHAVDYNKSVEDIENRMLFLNVVRAAKRHPMHFSRVTGITGNLEGSASLDGTGTLFDGSGADTLNLTTKLSGASKPSFTFQPLDSKKFFTGILSPVTVEMFNGYLRQGWQPKFLIHALAEKVEIIVDYKKGTGSDKKTTVKVCEISNDPRDPKEFERFALNSEILATAQARVVPKTEFFGPVLEAEQISEIGDFAELRKDGFKTDAEEGDTSFQLTRSSASLTFDIPGGEATIEHFRSVGARGLVELCNVDGFEKFKAALEKDQAMANTRTPLQVAKAQLDPPKLECPAGRVCPVTVGAQITLRSPQALLYYMGELLRVQFPRRFDEPAKAVRSIKLSGKLTPLLVVTEAPFDRTKKVAVRVTHQGDVFAIPDGPEAGRSMQLLTLARHLFSLNIEEEDFRAPQTVRFLN